MKGLVFAVILAFLAYQVYQFAPQFPEGLENASLARQIQETIIRTLFRLAINAERFGFIVAEDSSDVIQALASLAPQKNLSALDVPGEESTIANVPVVIFKKNPNAKNQRAIVYFHGGGFTMGSARSFSVWTSLLANSTGAVIISVDYRLAPQFPFPAAAEDCIAVTKAVFDSAQAMGIDRNRIAIAGDSAGANLATLVSLKLSSQYQIKAQILFSVVTLAPGVLPLPSILKYSHLYPISADWFLAKYAGQKFTKAMEKSIYSRQYISVEDTQRLARFIKLSSLPDDLMALVKNDWPSSLDMDLTDSGLSQTVMASLPPEVKAVSKLALNDHSWLLLLENDQELVKMPPSFFSICEFDMRRDEGLLFYSKLRSLGVPVALSYLRKAEHDELVVNLLTSSKFTKAGRKGFEDAVAYINEML